MTNRYKAIHKELKKLIQKSYGKRCGDFEIGCIVCQKYLMLDILLDCSFIYDEIKKDTKKTNL